MDSWHPIATCFLRRLNFHILINQKSVIKKSGTYMQEKVALEKSHLSSDPPDPIPAAHQGIAIYSTAACLSGALIYSAERWHCSNRSPCIFRLRLRRVSDDKGSIPLIPILCR